MNTKRVTSGFLGFGILLSMLGVFYAPEAEAHKCWRGKNGRAHCNNGRQYYYDNRRSSWVDYQTGKILKGGLVGAGIGAGTGLLLDRNVGKSALIGAGLGAGTQAVRYSRTMDRHPIVKTAAYGALAGTGVNALRRKDMGTGALWGAGLGAGLGALQHMD